MKHYRLTPAFSMLELIFVIVILGIVASIGSEMIVRVYEQYIVQRAQHRASLKTELVATQIANRLASAIPGTVIRRNTLSTGAGSVIEGINDYMSDTTGDSYIALQWVGSDSNSFNYQASTNPGWSGFCDINSSSTSQIITPGSDLASISSTIKSNLGITTTSHFAIYFPYDTTAYYGTGTGETITLDNNASHIVEHYKLAVSSYALVVTDGDLYLHYNFDPTRAIDIGTTRSLLMKNISTFKFKGAGRTIRFKICKEERISEDVNITACKEKAVF